MVIYYILSAFGGYLLGRFGHAYLNVWIERTNWVVPHHWIYGAIFMVVGIVIRSNEWGWLVFSFGLGHFISDLKDFTELKLISPDEKGPKKFWGID